MIPISDALVGSSLPIRAVRDETRYAARSDAASTVSLGSMADNLRNALKGR